MCSAYPSITSLAAARPARASSATRAAMFGMLGPGVKRTSRLRP